MLGPAVSPIAPILSIAPIQAIPPILAIPRVVAGSFRPKNRFHLDDWPEGVRKTFALGRTKWLEALALAIALKITDEKRLADLIFFMHHPERMKLGEGRLIDAGEQAFVKLRAEWNHYRVIVARRLKSTTPSVFQKPVPGRRYEDFVAPPTKGVVSLFVHGRRRDAKGKVEQTAEGCAAMQQAVEAAGPKDSIFIANWQFIPTEMNLKPYNLGKKWGELLLDKARQGVKIRVIVSKIPDGTGFQAPMNLLSDLVGDLPDTQRPNFKFILSAHPDDKGSHHQKLLIVTGPKATTAFCGGVDISRSRAPPWSTDFVWHDIHAKFEGAIARDLEREFILRWNREKTKNAASEIEEWNGLEKLEQGPPGQEDGRKGKARNMQMLRTVAFSRLPKDFRRDDIWQGYFRLIGRATRFLYLENQYFHEAALGDAIARQVESQPGLIVMIAVSTGTDDLKNANLLTRLYVGHQRALRHDFFTRLSGIPKDRLRIYTIYYPDGLLHSKLIMADDEVLSIGSANANPMGFFFNTEVNVMVEEPETVRRFRHQLWAHNLGVAEEAVARWRVKDYFDMWDMIAEHNRDLESAPERMFGDSVLTFKPLDPRDKRYDPGQRIPLINDIFF